MKCIIDPTSGLPCKRCAKARRQCIVTPPTRKRQKKADSRVAELERKIDALTATLQAREASMYDGGIQLDQLKAESTSPYAQHRSPRYDQRVLAAQTSPPVSRQDDRPNEGADKRRRLSRIDTSRTEHMTLPSNAGAYRSSAAQLDNTRIPTPTSDPVDRGSIYNQQRPETFDHARLLCRDMSCQ